MDMNLRENINSRYRALIKAEQILEKRAVSKKDIEVLSELKGKIPTKAVNGLYTVFNKAFHIVFTKGTSVVEKTYDAQYLRFKHDRFNNSLNENGRKGFTDMYLDSAKRQLGNLALSTVEGVCMGLAGIGLPDAVAFVGFILKGVYETALNFGFDYNIPTEKLFILKMLQASLSKGKERETLNRQVDEMIYSDFQIHEESFEQEIKRASEIMVDEMLLCKFVQGIPIIGAAGGMFNGLFYNRIICYVQLKYQKRYLLKLAQQNNVNLEQR